MPPRPLEGRISRLIGPNQMVRCVIKDGRIEYVPYVPKISIEMDKVSVKFVNIVYFLQEKERKMKSSSITEKQQKQIKIP